MLRKNHLLSALVGVTYCAFLLSCSSNGGTGSASASSSSSVTAISCPAGYLLVPKNSNYTSSDFCVAKYPAVQVGAVGASLASGSNPWVFITRPNAITACQANGPGYDLITNAEWQTIAQNIELVSSNWSGNVIGSSGGLNVGINGYQASAVAVSSNDNNSCFQTGQTCSSTVWHANRRTFTLSNGEVIWDFSGNISQWVKETPTTIVPYTDFGATSFISSLSSITHPNLGVVGGLTGTTKFHFGPSGDYSSQTVLPNGGLGQGYFANLNSIIRGGSYATGTSAGIFATRLTMNVTNALADTGFRCVYHP